jgi:hypothetical protein
MSQPVTIFDDSNGAEPVLVRLAEDVEQLLGIDAEVAVRGVKTQGGMLLVDVQGDGVLTRWLLPPTAFRWIKQDIQQSPTPPPPDQG